MAELRYVESAAVLSGWPAHLIHRLLHAPHVAELMEAVTPAWARAEVEATRRAIARAAAAYEALPLARNGETGGRETAADSKRGAVAIGSGEAARLLGLSRRRAQQLAAELDAPSG